VKEVRQVIYVTEATALGGRDGGVRTSDGRLDLSLDMPTELGGSGGPGTNPEQLFASGYAGCFLEALKAAARSESVSIENPTVSAQVGIGSTDDGFGLQIQLTVGLPGLDSAVGQLLVDSAHDQCPYSRATRGNIRVDVRLA